MSTENTTNKLELDGLSIKLTDEKLFITTSTSTETFGLRSIDGIGVVDLVDDLNKELNFYKQARANRIMYMVLGVVLIPFGLFMYRADMVMFAIVEILSGLIIFLYQLINLNKMSNPTLKSAVRIMMAGGNRDFTFDKALANSSDVAEFVARVEDTLTAFHKK